MNYRVLGKTGLKISILGFGCGNMGGLLVRSDHKMILKVLARAIELGINYFDTAAQYGDGKSETNLGIALKELRADDVHVGTKIKLSPKDLDNIPESVKERVDSSLKRVGRESVDLIQLHNYISLSSKPGGVQVSVADLELISEAFSLLQKQGKVRFWGITGLGETEALLQVIDSGLADSVQACYNLINPTAGRASPREFPYQDFQRLIDRAVSSKMGVLAIRILAGGALSGRIDRHPVAGQPLTPIASSSYEADVEKSNSFRFLVEKGITSNLVEAAIRFAISKAGISTALLGISDLEQLEKAVEYVNHGPLPEEAFNLLKEVYENFD